MPRPAVLDGRSRRLAPVPGAGRGARRRTDGSNRRRPPAKSGRRTEIGLPRLCRPPDIPRNGWEL